jgi:uncharacterized membrane protein YkvA (DUF1232 family)
MFKKLKDFTRHIKKELRIYKSLLKDSRTPFIAKIFLFLAVGYLALPFDLIPDFIPILGQLDDLIIIPFLIWIALQSIPSDLIEEKRKTIV